MGTISPSRPRAQAPLTAQERDSRAREIAHHRAWTRIASEVILNAAISAEARFRIAYRATFTGDYAINAAALRSRPIARVENGRTGLGREVLQRTDRELREAGYHRRRQAADGYARERLTLPRCADGEGIFVRQSWFESAVLTIIEMMAWLYLRASAAEARNVSGLAANMGWHRETAAKAINSLLGFGLIETAMRTADGVAYRALKWQNPAPKSGAFVEKATRAFVEKRTRTLITLSSKELINTHSEYAFRPTGEQAPPLSENCEAEAFTNAKLLASVAEAELREDVDPNAIEMVRAAAPDDGALARRLRRAAGGRLAREIVSPAGLWSVRYLAAIIMRDGQTPSAKALAAVLRAIQARIGDREGARLHSLAVIAQRIVAETEHGPGATMFFIRRKPHERSRYAA